MNENQALEQFMQQIPATGEVDYEIIDNALRITPDGRAARSFFHKLRRAGKIKTRVNRETGSLMVSRPVQGIAPAITKGVVTNG
jgi:hypothetical protein